MDFVSFSLTVHPTYAFPLPTGFGASRLAAVLCCSKNGGDCGGLFGASGGSNAFQLCEKAMQSLKHRGEREICIATGGEGVLTRTLKRKLNDEDQPKGYEDQPKGSVGIASCSNQMSDVAKPVLSEDASVAVAFVGKILNYSKLKKSLPHEKMIGDSSESELVLHLLRSSSSSVLLETRVLRMCEAIQGEYCLLMIADGWLIAARSPRGMFPLVKGKSSSDTTIFGTEASCVDSLGYCDREMFPGEILMVKNGVQKSFNMIRKFCAKHCLMEQIYLCGQETKEVFNRSVDRFRILIASRLVLKGDEEPDVILVASDASIKIAGAYSVATGIRFGGRVFAFHTQFLNKVEMSKKIAKHRKEGNFHPRGLFSGQRILLFDDGGVVSKCSETILESLRSYTCATEVHLKLICPEIRSACPYGVNLKAMGYKEETEAYVKQYDSCSRIYAGDLKTFILKKEADQYCLQCMQEQ
ncbi:hypothetical protein AAC387_Pa06g0139 [Persea americana]